MQEVDKAFQSLDDLCNAIKHFALNDAKKAIYKAPIIDHFHPDDYHQDGISGLKKFLGTVEAERDYVDGVSAVCV
jgi:hypothetical protein